MTHKHLLIQEREKIQKLFWEKKSLGYIALQIRKPVSTISREIKRNCPVKRKYIPRSAHARALLKRAKRGRTDRLKDELVRTYVKQNGKHTGHPNKYQDVLQKILNTTYPMKQYINTSTVRYTETVKGYFIKMEKICVYISNEDTKEKQRKDYEVHKKSLDYKAFQLTTDQYQLTQENILSIGREILLFHEKAQGHLIPK